MARLRAGTEPVVLSSDGDRISLLAVNLRYQKERQIAIMGKSCYRCPSLSKFLAAATLPPKSTGK